jgi:hypothetical protein
MLRPSVSPAVVRASALPLSQKSWYQQNGWTACIQALAHLPSKRSKNVRKAAGDKLGACMLTLAQFAFAEYSRSANQSNVSKLQQYRLYPAMKM